MHSPRAPMPRVRAGLRDAYPSRKTRARNRPALGRPRAPRRVRPKRAAQDPRGTAPAARRAPPAGAAVALGASQQACSDPPRSNHQRVVRERAGLRIGNVARRAHCEPPQAPAAVVLRAAPPGCLATRLVLHGRVTSEAPPAVSWSGTQGSIRRRSTSCANDAPFTPTAKPAWATRPSEVSRSSTARGSQVSMSSKPLGTCSAESIRPDRTGRSRSQTGASFGWRSASYATRFAWSVAPTESPNGNAIRPSFPTRPLRKARPPGPCPAPTANTCPTRSMRAATEQTTELAAA